MKLNIMAERLYAMANTKQNQILIFTSLSVTEGRKEEKI